jgi:hypothetical protein
LTEEQTEARIPWGDDDFDFSIPEKFVRQRSRAQLHFGLSRRFAPGVVARVAVVCAVSSLLMAAPRSMGADSTGAQPVPSASASSAPVVVAAAASVAPDPSPTESMLDLTVASESPSLAVSPTPVVSQTPVVRKMNLYARTLVRYQNPDRTACTAAATLVMLNFIAHSETGGAGFVWQPTTSYATQERILAWERGHDTLEHGAPGSDAHGWRNALNNFGWNNYTNASGMHYEDFSYGSYDAAIRAAIHSVAAYGKPVGILGWGGGHAQILTGYEVSGADPARSNDYSVVAIYLTDPLASNKLINARISYRSFRTGPLVYRFRTYVWQDSPYDDSYDAGSIASYKEWFGKWVIVAPVR